MLFFSMLNVTHILYCNDPAFTYSCARCEINLTKALLLLASLLLHTEQDSCRTTLLFEYISD
jgi:hypothetical protein